MAEGCSLNSNCDDPLVCTFARCHEECNKDRDCPGESRCVMAETGGVCQLALETACTRDSQCSGEQVCGIDGECRDSCTKDQDCGEEQLCAKSGECASTLGDKDLVDANGNIEADPFSDLGSGGGGGGGRGGADSSGDAGDTSASGKGSGGKGSGTSGTSGKGNEASAGEGGEPGLVCPAGTKECGGTDTTDCETDVSLITSCGDCEKACDLSHGTGHCDAPKGYVCVVDKCTAGYDDCDDDGTNSCESLLAEDPKNCGKCGNDCAGGTCKAGLCSAGIVMDPLGPNTTSTFYEAKLVGTKIVASVYVGTSYQLRTVTLPVTDPPSEGTVLQTFASSGARRDGTLEADDTYAYWATNSSPYAVDRKPLADPGANIQEMFTAPGPVHQLKLTLSAFYYFGYGGASPTYGFFTAAKTLGASAQPIANLGSRYSSIGGMTIAGVGANARFYWPEYSPGVAKYQVFTAPLSGASAPVVVDADVGNSTYLGAITDGTFGYWNTYAANGKIRRANSGDNPTQAQDVVVSASYPGYPGDGFVTDGAYVYFLDNSYNIWRAKSDGSSAVQSVLDRGNSAVYLQHLFGVDATYLYGGANGGQIARVRKAPAP